VVTSRRGLEQFLADQAPAGEILPPGSPAGRPEPAVKVEGARGLVQVSRDSAVREPRAWVPYSVKLPAVLAGQLREWVTDEFERAGDRNLAVSHVVNAALTVIPVKPSAAAEFGLAWQRVHGATSAPAVDASGSGTRLHRDVAAAMTLLSRRLRGLDVRVWAWQVHAGAVAALLADLGADGPGSVRRS
jgi:hypothetical protein